MGTDLKCHPFWLDFMVMEDIIHTIGEEEPVINSSTVYLKSFGNDCLGKISLLAW